MTNFGTGHLQKIIIFKLLLKPSFASFFGHLGLFARSNFLNANRHLARFVTFEVVICEILLYQGEIGKIWIQEGGSKAIVISKTLVMESTFLCNLDNR